jgi:hypothetical protein
MKDTWKPMINALLRAPVAWRSPAQLADSVRRGVAETTAVLIELTEAGWIEFWKSESGPQVTLSPWAAERLRVRLVEVGPDGLLRWVRVGEPHPPQRALKNRIRMAHVDPDVLLDDEPPPDCAAEQAEQAEQRASAPREARRAFRERTPRPAILIGEGLIPWPGPREALDATCPVCADRPLRPRMYCLRCDRWGMDHLLFPNRPKGWKPPREAHLDSRSLPKLSRKERRSIENGRSGGQLGSPNRSNPAAQPTPRKATRNGANPNGFAKKTKSH